MEKAGPVTRAGEAILSSYNGLSRALKRAELSLIITTQLTAQE